MTQCGVRRQGVGLRSPKLSPARIWVVVNGTGVQEKPLWRLKRPSSVPEQSGAPPFEKGGRYKFLKALVCLALRWEDADTQQWPAGRWLVPLATRRPALLLEVTALSPGSGWEVVPSVCREDRAVLLLPLLLSGEVEARPQLQWPRVCEDRSGGASVPAEGLAFLGKGAGVLELGQGGGHTSLQESPELGKRRGRCAVTGVVCQGHCRVSGPASRAHCAVLSFYGLLGSDAGLETGPRG